MVCVYCGAKNDDSAAFCTSCGQPLVKTDSNIGVNAGTPQQGAGNSTGGGTAAPTPVNSAGARQSGKSKSLMPVILGGCAALVALIVIILVIVNSKPTIKLDDYLSFESSGYDGYGRTYVVIDWDGIEEKYGEKLSFTKQFKKDSGEFGDLISSLITPMDLLRSSISVQLENTSELSNGDVIAYTWNVEEELYTYVKCKTKYSDDSYTVEGLTEIGAFDPFAGLEVTFSGISPNGWLEYDYNGSPLNTYDFNYDKYSGLRNGDTVTFSIGNTNMEYYAQNYGMIPTSLEKEYVVSGLDEYIESYGKLTDDFIAGLKSETEDTIYAYAAKSYNATSSLTNLAYVGYALNSVKDASASYYGYNELYIIYSGTVSSSNGSFSTSRVFFPVRYYNVLSGENGLSYEGKDSNIAGRSNLDGSGSTYGYRNPITCYMELVEAKRDSYTSECGDGFEAYANYEFIAGLDDISDEYKAILYADAQDKVQSYIANATGWYDAYGQNGTEVSDFGRLGEYLLLAKTQGNDFAYNNKFIIVFAANVSNSDGRFGTATVYYPVEYDGIVKLPGGEYMTTTTVGLINNTVTISDSSYRTRGYTDGTEMYTRLVTANRENYTYQMTDGLKQFGE